MRNNRFDEKQTSIMETGSHAEKTKDQQNAQIKQKKITQENVCREIKTSSKRT